MEEPQYTAMLYGFGPAEHRPLLGDQAGLGPGLGSQSCLGINYLKVAAHQPKELSKLRQPNPGHPVLTCCML